MKTHILKRGFYTSTGPTFGSKKSLKNQIWIEVCMTGHYPCKAAHIHSSQPAITRLCQLKACYKFSFPPVISKADSF